MRLRVLFGLAALMVAPMAFAGSYSLNDWCFYVNSLDINQSCKSGSGRANVPSADPGVTDLLHLQADNTGTLTVTLAPGNYNVFAIFNYNLDGSALNEYANVVGQLSAGQVYSVNNEGSTGTAGSLFAQGAGGTLDNTNHCASGCTDVAVAIGYTDVTVPAGSTGTITFTAGSTPPASGGYIQQTDNGAGNGTGSTIDISSGIQIDGGLTAQIASPVPEPGAMGLMGGGIGALLFFLRRRKA
jgi:hypothetical protein